MSNHATIQRDGYSIPLIGIPSYGTLNECSECHDDFGILNHNDGENYIILTGPRFICKVCLDKEKKYE